jgi:hypothetical protein
MLRRAPAIDRILCPDSLKVLENQEFLYLNTSKVLIELALALLKKASGIDLKGMSFGYSIFLILKI